MAVLAEQQQSLRHTRRPVSAHSLRVDQPPVDASRTAQQHAPQREAGMVCEPEATPAGVPDSTGIAGCARSTPWLASSVQHRQIRDPQPVWVRCPYEDDARQQCRPETRGSSPDVHVDATAMPLDGDSKSCRTDAAAALPTEPQNGAEVARVVAHQQSAKAEERPIAKQHFPDKQAAQLGDQQTQYRLAASPAPEHATASHPASQLVEQRVTDPGQQATFGGVPPEHCAPAATALEPRCPRCLKIGHIREACKLSDKAARKRRKKAKLAKKAAAVKAKVAHGIASSPPAANVSSLPEPPRAAKRKRKPKGAERAKSKDV